MDLLFAWNDDLMAGDLVAEAASLGLDDSLRTAVIVSLFTDRRARDDDALPAGAGDDRRGWWGDLLPPVRNDLIGSRLWLLAREKQTREVVARAREYAEEALAWLVEDGVAERVEVRAEIVRTGVLGLHVTIHRPQGAEEYRYRYVWEAAADAV